MISLRHNPNTFKTITFKVFGLKIFVFEPCNISISIQQFEFVFEKLNFLYIYIEV